MSDPFSDTNVSPWTRGGDPVPLSKETDDRGWTQPPPDQAWGVGPSWNQPAGQPQAPGQIPPGWQQPPPPDQSGGWQQPPPFVHQSPGYGRDPFGQTPYGPQPFGPPPNQGSGGSKVVWIVLAVVAVIIIGLIGAAVLVFNAASDGIGDVVEGFEDFSFPDAELPSGPRLLDTAGSVGAFDDTARFEFTVPDRTQVQIDVVGRNGFDPVVTLFQGGTELSDNDDGGGFLNARLSEDLSSGTYVVVVTGFGGDNGDFALIVTDL